MDSAVEMIDIGEGLMREEVAFQIAPGPLDVVEFRGVFRQPSMVSQSRAARAAREALLVWMGRLSSTKTTGLSGRPRARPVDRVEAARKAMKSLLILVALVLTIS